MLLFRKASACHFQLEEEYLTRSYGPCHSFGMLLGFWEGFTAIIVDGSTTCASKFKPGRSNI